MYVCIGAYVFDFFDFLACFLHSRFSLLESIPQNLTYGPHQYVCNSTFSGIEKMLSMAKSHVDIASFYWTMRGDDTSFYDGSAIQVYAHIY